MTKKGKGKKGKKGKKKGGSKKGKKTFRRVVQKKSLAAMLGGAVTAYKAETYTPPGFSKNILGVQVQGAKTLLRGDVTSPYVREAVVETGKAVMANSGPALVGAAISYGEDVPLVGGLYKDLIKRPLDRMFGKLQRRLTKRKARYKF